MVVCLRRSRSVIYVPNAAKLPWSMRKVAASVTPADIVSVSILFTLSKFDDPVFTSSSKTFMVAFGEGLDMVNWASQLAHSYLPYMAFFLPKYRRSNLYIRNQIFHRRIWGGQGRAFWASQLTHSCCLLLDQRVPIHL